MSKSPSVVSLEYALSDWILNEYPFSVINGEVIARAIFKFYHDKSYGNQRIARIRASEPGQGVYSNHIAQLINSGIISELPEFRSPISAKYPFYGSYVIKSKTYYSSIQAACAIFPYAHVAYLSAMEWHGLTDKNPTTVYLSTPPKVVWREIARRELSDFKIEEYSNFNIENFLPKFPTDNQLFDSKISVSIDKDTAGVVQVRDSPVRVTSAARTFLDMIRKPSLCGGVDHAIACFIEEANPHRKTILKYVGENGTKIDRARIGFLMDKVMKIKDSRLDEWRQESSLTRGSSKVLVPGTPFSEYYDPDWSLSINLEFLQEYGIK